MLGERLLEPVGDRVNLGAVRDNSCLEYRVKLQPAQSRVQTGGPETRRVGRDMLTSIGDWMWRPQEPQAGLELSFRLPSGVEVSAPWQRTTGSDGRPVFLVGATPYNWSGVVAFGHFAQRDVQVPGAVVHLVLLDAPTTAQQAQSETWIENTARQVALLYGRFPVASFPALCRGARCLAVRGPADLSAECVDARGGATSLEEAWQRMQTGFQRGARTASNLSLARASERIGYNGIYQRVYWAGAALMLAADLQLRSRTGGRQSIDTALEQLSRCCASDERRWNAQEIIARLDEVTGTTVFSDLVHAQFEVDGFPDYEADLARAGVKVEGTQVEFDASAPWAAERDALRRPSAIAPR